MPTVEQNLTWWGKSDGWKEDGDIWSEKWGGTELEWCTSIFPRIRQFLPANTILEIAPGFGRWTQFLKGFCRQLIAVDVSTASVERCKERFASDPHVRCFVNDGKSLPMVEDGSIDFAFSFDSLVHVEADVIAAYAKELARTLKPDAFAFLHHSNLGAYHNSLWLPKAIEPKQEAGPNGSAPAMTRSRWLRRRLHATLTDWGMVSTFDNRAESVSARTFREACDAAGLRCCSQELVNWNHGRSLIDCFSVVTRSDGKSHGAPRMLLNPDFMDEASHALRTTVLYQSLRPKE